MSGTPAGRVKVGFRERRGPILLAIMLSMFLVGIDSTVLATSVPTIVDDLDGFAHFPWLFSIYLLTQSVTVPIYSKLADMLGRKPVLLAGIGIFLVASVLCGLAWDMTSLIAFRGLQGVGAGAVVPIAITIVGDIYTVEERGRVQGYTGSMWAISAVVGPLIGGAFSQYMSWRLIFFINIPLCLFAMWQLWRHYHERVERTRRRIDYAGAATLSIGLSAVILGFLEGGIAWPWFSPQTFIVFGIGALSLLVFVPIERRAPEPILDMRLVTQPMILSTAIVATFGGALTIGLSSFAPTYLENSIGTPPLVSGLAAATLAFGWPVASATSARLYLRFGFRTTVLIGSTICLLGTIGLTLVTPWPNPVTVAVFMFVVGFGMGWSSTPIIIAVQSTVGWAERGAASGVNQLTRSVGSTVGVAVFGAILGAVVAAGAGPRDFDTIVSATQWVFFAAACAALLQLATAFTMPKTDVTTAMRESAAAAPDGVPASEPGATVAESGDCQARPA